MTFEDDYIPPEKPSPPPVQKQESSIPGCLLGGVGGLLGGAIWLIVFFGCWAYAVATFGWFLGLAFGWFPAAIIA